MRWQHAATAAGARRITTNRGHMARELSGPPVVVMLPEDIDFTNSDDAAADLLGARDTPGLTIADMTATTFCGSMGMRMLVLASDHIAAAGSTHGSSSAPPAQSHT
jgi:anti-anti-sigma regulatory factor